MEIYTTIYKDIDFTITIGEEFPVKDLIEVTTFFTTLNGCGRWGRPSMVSLGFYRSEEFIAVGLDMLAGDCLGAYLEGKQLILFDHWGHPTNKLFNIHLN